MQYSTLLFIALLNLITLTLVSQTVNFGGHISTNYCHTYGSEINGIGFLNISEGADYKTIRGFNPGYEVGIAFSAKPLRSAKHNLYLAARLNYLNRNFSLKWAGTKKSGSDNLQFELWAKKSIGDIAFAGLIGYSYRGLNIAAGGKIYHSVNNSGSYREVINGTQVILFTGKKLSSKEYKSVFGYDSRMVRFSFMQEISYCVLNKKSVQLSPYFYATEGFVNYHGVTGNAIEGSSSFRTAEIGIGIICEYSIKTKSKKNDTQ